MNYRHIVQDFLEMDFSLPLRKPEKPLTEDQLRLARNQILDDLNYSRLVFMDKTNSKYVGEFGAIPAITDIEKDADTEAGSISLTEEEKRRYMEMFLSSVEEFQSTFKTSHFETFELFIKRLQEKFGGSKVDLPGFRRVCDELESWSRSSDINNYGKALFRYFVFFRLMRAIIFEFSQKVMTKMRLLLDRPNVLDLDIILLSGVGLYLDAIHATMFCVCRLNTTPALMVPSSIMYQSFKNKERYVLSNNVCAKLLTKDAAKNYSLRGTVIIEVPSVMWMNEDFDLNKWSKMSDTARTEWLTEDKNAKKQDGEYIDDLISSYHGRRHVYLMNDKEDVAAYYAADQDILLKILCLRPLVQEKEKKLWRVIVNTLEYIKTPEAEIKEIAGRYEVGKDNKFPISGKILKKWPGKFRSWR